MYSLPQKSPYMLLVISVLSVFIMRKNFTGKLIADRSNIIQQTLLYDFLSFNVEIHLTFSTIFGIFAID